MLVSMTSSSAPSATATATNHLLTGTSAASRFCSRGCTGSGAGATTLGFTRSMATADGASVAMAPSASVDGQLDAHPRTKGDIRRHLRDLHANRHALDDLREVAGRVVGRQKREL